MSRHGRGAILAWRSEPLLVVTGRIKSSHFGSNQKQPLRVESKAATLRRVFHNGFRFLIKSSLGFAMLNRSAPAAS